MGFTVQQMRDIVGNGKFFGVLFIKRTDGQLRHMVARTGVIPPPPPSGQERTWDPADKGLLQVWDVGKRAYRMVPCDSIQEVHFRGQRIVP